jgi:hypothetical protein
MSSKLTKLYYSVPLPKGIQIWDDGFHASIYLATGKIKILSATIALNVSSPNRLFLKIKTFN